MDEVVGYARRHGREYDLIHGHYADGWYSAHHLARRWDCPFVVSTHSLGKRKRANALAMNEGTEAELDEKYAFTVRIGHETETLRAADRICPLTHEEGEYILEHYEGVDRERVHSVPNGILLSEFQPPDETATGELRRRLGIAEDELVVLQIGRVDRRKDGCIIADVVEVQIDGVPERLLAHHAIGRYLSREHQQRAADANLVSITERTR